MLCSRKTKRNFVYCIRRELRARRVFVLFLLRNRDNNIYNIMTPPRRRRLTLYNIIYYIT